MLARLSLTAVHGAAGELDRARATFAEIPARLVPASWLALSRGWSVGMATGVDAVLQNIADAAARARDGGNRVLAAQAWQVAIEVDRAEAAVVPLAAMAAECDSSFIALMASHAEAAARGDHAGLLEVSDAWEQRDGLRLAAAAAASAAQALGTARPAAAARARARADDLVRRCGGLAIPVLRTDGSSSPLTPREQEIATLAAGGASSKEIAAQLFLSSRTVDNHLQAVYMKLGVKGRQELRQLRF